MPECLQPIRHLENRWPCDAHGGLTRLTACLHNAKAASALPEGPNTMNAVTAHAALASSTSGYRTLTRVAMRTSPAKYDPAEYGDILPSTQNVATVRAGAARQPEVVAPGQTVAFEHRSNSLAQSARHARSTMIGSRCTTTLRKLPMTQPNTMVKPVSTLKDRLLTTAYTVSAAYSEWTSIRENRNLETFLHVVAGCVFVDPR